MTPEQTAKALDAKFFCFDLDTEITVKGYLKELLATLLEKEESFSGKRPFGNSGWLYDLARPLIAAGVVEGQIVDDEPIHFEIANVQSAAIELVDAL